MGNKISIAIDGPAGAGKTTVAQNVAKRLGYKYVDTGAMYRAVAWKCLQLSIPLSNESSIVDMTAGMCIDFADGDGSRILVDGVDVSQAIRAPEVTRLSSPVSAIPGVRRLLQARQKELGESGGVVMEGRDIGSIVLPDAQVKIFLTASIEARAQRRGVEMHASGMQIDLDCLRKDIEERDRRDSSREDSPLVVADGAVTIDTDDLTVEQVVDRVISLCVERGASPVFS